MAGASKIVWFRKGLRLHDNPALLEACKGATNLYPVFIIDPHFLKNGGYKVGVNRYNFLLECLTDLNASLKARGSRLLVVRGQPQEVLPKLFKDWNINQLCYEVDVEPYALTRDADIGQLAAAAGVKVKACVSHTLYDTDWLVRQNGGRAPVTMQQFTKLVDRLGDPPAPAADPPAMLPPPGANMPGAGEEQTSVPTLAELGFTDPVQTPFRGGESEALLRLEAQLQDKAWVAAFEKPATDPSAFLKPATTVLSPYLKFGCVSARLFHARLLGVYRASKAHSKPPVSLRGQLLWREFFYTVGSHTPNFNTMVGNPLCKQIPWDVDQTRLLAWKEGRTGYPWIDAIMVQLQQWGWMHHLARHSVACFLTRGDLYQSWMAGQEVFEELLIDADYFINAGNWQWLSASAFFSQYYRVYSPVTFGKKYDTDGKFIRHFLPQLKDFPPKYIYEPWTAPLEVQRRCGCIIGKDYPFPIVDHTSISKTNMARMKEAYTAAKSAPSAGNGSDDDGNSDEEATVARRLGSSKRALSVAAKKAGKQAAAAAAAAAPPDKKQRKINDMLVKKEAAGGAGSSNGAGGEGVDGTVGGVAAVLGVAGSSAAGAGSSSVAAGAGVSTADDPKAGGTGSMMAV